MDSYNQLQDYEAFKEKLPSLLKEHAGEFAVIHNEKIVEIFSDERGALNFARTKYGSGRFIVQEIHNRSPVPLSYSLLI